MNKTSKKTIPMIVLIGLGSEKEISNNQAWSQFGSQAAAMLTPGTWETVGVSTCGIDPLIISENSICALFSSLLAFHEKPDNLKSEKASHGSTVFQAIGFGDNVDMVLSKAKQIAQGIRTTRNLVNAPANLMTPTALAKVATDLANVHCGSMKIHTMDHDSCKDFGEHGMGLFLGVAKGSSEPPKFIHLIYTGERDHGKENRQIAFVGKGVTFDSGGLNLKAGSGSLIELMKFDMGGAATLLGAATSIALLKPKGVTIHFVIPACENMVSSVALKPGDVIVASNGTTVEVNNTDAEGRLTLADALLYVQHECPQCTEILDVATLTGACIVALGSDVAGLMCNDERMALKVEAAAQEAGENVWRLPLHKPYREGLKSMIADLKNTGPRPGGTITAGLFLNEFIKDDKIKWAHVDIAGPVWNDAKGATGFATSLLIHFATRKL